MCEQVVKTLIDQAHLTPLPLMACPINWAFDPSLQLFPLPDVVRLLRCVAMALGVSRRVAFLLVACGRVD